MIPIRFLHPSLLALALGGALSAHAVTYTFANDDPNPEHRLKFTATLDDAPMSLRRPSPSPSDLSFVSIGAAWGQLTNYAFILDPHDEGPIGDVFLDHVRFQYDFDANGIRGGDERWYFTPGAFAKEGAYASIGGAGGIRLAVVPEPASRAGLALGALALRRRTRGRRA